MVGYHEKRQKTDLEHELEASLEEKPGMVNTANRTDAFNTRQTQAKLHIKQRDQFEVIEQDKGINSDFDGNFTDMYKGTLRTRKLYSQ